MTRKTETRGRKIKGKRKKAAAAAAARKPKGEDKTWGLEEGGQACGRWGLTSSGWSIFLSLRGRRSLRPFFKLGFLSAAGAQAAVSEASWVPENPQSER